MDVQKFVILFRRHWVLVLILVVVLTPIIWAIAKAVYGERISILEERLKLCEKECTYGNVRISGNPWPPPGKTITIDEPFVPIEWESEPECSATVQAYFASELIFSAQMHSPTAVNLNHGPGRYEIKIWEKTQGRPPLKMTIVELADKKY